MVGRVLAVAVMDWYFDVMVAVTMGAVGGMTVGGMTVGGMTVGGMTVGSVGPMT